MLLGALVAQVGLLVLSQFVSPVTADGPWSTIEGALWLASNVVAIVGLLELAGGLADKSLSYVSAAGWALIALFEVARLASSGRLGLVVNDVEVAISLGAHGALMLLMLRLAKNSRAWLVPLLGACVLLTLTRTSLSLAMLHGLLSWERYLTPTFAYALAAVSFFNAIAVVFGAVALRLAVKGEPRVATDEP